MDEIEILKKRVEVYRLKKIKVHVSIRDGGWCNGYVTEVSSDFFMIDEVLNGLIPVFFQEIMYIEPYKNKGDDGNGNF